MPGTDPNNDCNDNHNSVLLLSFSSLSSAQRRQLSASRIDIDFSRHVAIGWAPILVSTCSVLPVIIVELCRRWWLLARQDSLQRNQQRRKPCVQ